MDGVPGYVCGVLKTLGSNGFEAYLVGGCLRDTLLGRPVHDWDIATSALGADVMRIFPKTVKTGARFGTVAVITGGGAVEVTTFRSDGSYSDRRRPDSVTFVGDLHEDLKRRDFTVNAMAMATDGMLIDPFGGREDIKRKRIRCVGDPKARFSEDALRMFRALRFAAQLSFEIEDGTEAAIKKCAPLCAALSAERVRDETEKILLSGEPKRIGTALALGLFKGRIQDGALEAEKLGRLAALPKTASLRWSAFSALLDEADLIASPKEFLMSMRLDSKTVRRCSAGVKTAQKALPDQMADIKRLLADLGAGTVLCAAAAEKALRDTPALENADEVINGGECWSVGELAIDGNDLIELGFKKGIAVGETLRALLQHVIERPESNTRERLLMIAREMRD